MGYFSTHFDSRILFFIVIFTVLFLISIYGAIWCIGRFGGHSTSYIEQTKHVFQTLYVPVHFISLETMFFNFAS